nr:glycosyltransferase [Nocardioides convexus]
MRVLTVIAALGAGGAEAVAVELALSAAADAHDVVVASTPGFRVERLREAGVEHVPLRLLGRRPGDLLASLRRLRRLPAPDLVHAHNPKAALVARLAVGPRVPVVTTLHGVGAAEARRAAHLLRRTSDRIVVVSPHLREEPDRLRRAGGADRGGRQHDRAAAVVLPAGGAGRARAARRRAGGAVPGPDGRPEAPRPPRRGLGRRSGARHPAARGHRPAGVADGAGDRAPPPGRRRPAARRAHRRAAAARRQRRARAPDPLGGPADQRAGGDGRRRPGGRLAGARRHRALRQRRPAGRIRLRPGAWPPPSRRCSATRGCASGCGSAGTSRSRATSGPSAWSRPTATSTHAREEEADESLDREDRARVAVVRRHGPARGRGRRRPAAAHRCRRLRRHAAGAAGHPVGHALRHAHPRPPVTERQRCPRTGAR